MRIAVTNTVALNGGDAAIAMALVAALRKVRPDASLEIHEAQPNVAARYFPHLLWKPQVASLVGPRISLPKTRILQQRIAECRIGAGLVSRDGHVQSRPWRSSKEDDVLQEFGTLDAIVSTGGTYLVPQYPMRSRLFEFDTACRLGIPIVFYTQSMGPFTDVKVRRRLAPILDASPLVLLRDDRSKQHLRDLGVDHGQVHVVADPVFRDAPLHPEFRPLPRDRPLRLGLSVRAWPPGTTISHPKVQVFVAELATGFTSLLRDTGASLTIVSTCQGVPEYWTDDAVVGQSIREAIDADVRHRCLVETRFFTPAEFRERLRDLDLYISTRMHGAIQSLTAGTPVVPIAYEFKTIELFRRLGLSRFVSDIDHFDSRTLVRTVKGYIADFDDHRASLGTAVGREAEAARAADALLDAALPTPKMPPRVSGGRSQTSQN